MSRIKNILVPVDFSKASKRALRYASELAGTFDATRHVLRRETFQTSRRREARGRGTAPF
jgi:nucleotide-binding universal stress UspA family protein